MYVAVFPDWTSPMTSPRRFQIPSSRGFPSRSTIWLLAASKFSITFGAKPCCFRRKALYEYHRSRTTDPSRTASSNQGTTSGAKKSGGLISTATRCSASPSTRWNTSGSWVAGYNSPMTGRINRITFSATVMGTAAASNGELRLLLTIASTNVFTAGCNSRGNTVAFLEIVLSGDIIQPPS